VIKDVKFEENLEYRRSQESSTVIEDEEKKALKDEKQLVAHILGAEEELVPSSSSRRPRWIVQTLRDTGETPRSSFRERKPLRNFMNYMVLMSNIIDVEPSIF
jgi:hypothetical protein